VSWISGNCQGDKDWECTYGEYVTVIDPYTGEPERVWETWCRDVSGAACPILDGGGGLVKAVNMHPAPGGGW
jgi:hypothetical protein